MIEAQPRYNSATMKDLLHMTALDLLPYGASSCVKEPKEKVHLLSSYAMALKSFVESLAALLTGDLRAFDAQVGENLCQIRAYRILLFWQELKADPQRISLIASFLAKLRFLFARITKLKGYYAQQMQMKSVQRDKGVDCSFSITDFLRMHEVFFEVQEDLLFIYYAYFLNKYAVFDRFGIPVRINFQKLAEEFFLVKSRAKKIVHLYQRRLSILSCQYILAILAKYESLRSWEKLAKYTCFSSDEGRYVLPCYVVAKAILQDIKYKKIPISLVVEPANSKNKYQIDYVIDPRTEQYILANQLNSNDFEVALVFNVDTKIKSKSVFESMVQFYGIHKMIMSNMAQHPQYTGCKLSAFADNPFLEIDEAVIDAQELEQINLELEENKIFAVTQGCSMEDTSFFFIRHIYAESLKHLAGQTDALIVANS